MKAFSVALLYRLLIYFFQAMSFIFGDGSIRRRRWMYAQVFFRDIIYFPNAAYRSSPTIIATTKEVMLDMQQR